MSDRKFEAIYSNYYISAEIVASDEVVDESKELVVIYIYDDITSVTWLGRAVNFIDGPRTVYNCIKNKNYTVNSDTDTESGALVIDADENYAGIQIEITMMNDGLVQQDVANYYIRFLKSDFSPNASLERVIEMNDE
jgi:hypothetical protein